MKDGLKSYEKFAALGVHRVSSGNGVHAIVTEVTNKAFEKLNKEKTL